MQEWRGGIIHGFALKCQKLPDLVWFQLRFNRCRSTYTELLNQNPINSTAVGSSCVICVEICRIRSASFGPIWKQIKSMWTPSTHSWPLRLWILGKQVSSMPQHSSPMGEHEPLNNDWYSTRDWTEAGLRKILLHLVCFNRLLSKRGSQTLSSVFRLLWHLCLLRLRNSSVVTVQPLI